MGNAHQEDYDGKGWGGPRAASSQHLGEVVEVDAKNGRLRVRLHGFQDDEDSTIWSRLVVPFAGNDYGAFMVPDKGEQVLVQFINNDPRQAVVLGSIWHGKAETPDTISGDRVDHYSIVGRAGSRIQITEEQGVSGATIELTTPGGARVTLTEQDSGKVEVEYGDARMTLKRGEVNIRTSGTVKVQASSAQINAGSVDVKAATSTFSGKVRCDILETNMVISTVYTPGAGNIL